MFKNTGSAQLWYFIIFGHLATQVYNLLRARVVPGQLQISQAVQDLAEPNTESDVCIKNVKKTES